MIPTLHSTKCECKQYIQDAITVNGTHFVALCIQERRKKNAYAAKKAKELWQANREKK